MEMQCSVTRVIINLKFPTKFSFCINKNSTQQVWIGKRGQSEVSIMSPAMLPLIFTTNNQCSSFFCQQKMQPAQAPVIIIGQQDQTLGASFVKVWRWCHLMLHLWLRCIAEQERTQHSTQNNTIPHSDSDGTQVNLIQGWPAVILPELLPPLLFFLSSLLLQALSLQCITVSSHTAAHNRMDDIQPPYKSCFFHYARVIFISTITGHKEEC